MFSMMTEDDTYKLLNRRSADEKEYSHPDESLFMCGDVVQREGEDELSS